MTNKFITPSVPANSSFSSKVASVYSRCFFRTDKGIDDLIITEALDVATRDCSTKQDCIKKLSALNLLNAAIKDKRWKYRLSYGFIKGEAGELFSQLVDSPIDGVNVYYDKYENAVFFGIDNVVFSYHRVPLTNTTRSFAQSDKNIPVEWKGIRLQMIPVETFDIALAG